MEWNELIDCTVGSFGASSLYRFATLGVAMRQLFYGYGIVKENLSRCPWGGGFGCVQRTGMLISRGRVNRSSVLSMVLCTANVKSKSTAKGWAWQ